MEKTTINITLKIDKHEIINFESWLNQQLEIISLKIIPNTDKLYETNKTFKKLVKAVKTAQIERDKFINEHNINE